MLSDPLTIIVLIACLVVVVILGAGIGVFTKGGEVNHKYGNRLMRWRLGAQFIAVLVILGVVWLRSRGG